MYKDSAFALGGSIKCLQYPKEVKRINLSDKVIESTKYLAEMEYLTTTSISILLGCKRNITQKLLLNMWQSHLVRCIEVVTNSKPESVFKLWSPSVTSLPKSPKLACRLAILGAFYGRTKNMVPSFEWKIIRSKDKKSAMAEMTYIHAASKDIAKMSIDAPRRGEKPNPEADVYIFPTIEEAKLYTPAGKRYTTDIVLLNTKINFANLISDPV